MSRMVRGVWPILKGNANSFLLYSRREYTEDIVEFQPVSADEYVIRLTLKKTLYLTLTR